MLVEKRQQMILKMLEERKSVTVNEIKDSLGISESTIRRDLTMLDKENKLIKPVKGHFTKASVTPKKHLREFRLDSVEGINVGDELKADVFAAGDKVDIQGTSKGKGFQGVIKRHGQSRGPMGHGSMYHRRPGSMGSTSTPGRVYKGKNLPGHMGVETVTVQNLEIVKVDLDKNVLLIKGSVPGNKGAILKIRNSVKSTK